MLFGSIFGITLAARFEKPILAACALGFPLLWGFSDLFYWTLDALPVGGGACKVAMMVVACGTSVMAALLALREANLSKGPPITKTPAALGHQATVS